MARLIDTIYLIFVNTLSYCYYHLVLGRITGGGMGKLVGAAVVADRLTLDEVSASFVNCCDGMIVR